MMKILFFIGFLVLTYVFSSIPWGVLIAKQKNLDLKKRGSGNIGATNVYRSLGFYWAFLVFFLDALKGFLPVFFVQILYVNQPIYSILVSFVALFGHVFSLFLKFRGGKGAATGIGVVFALSPVIGGLSFVFACLIIFLTRVVSIATLSTCVVLPILFYVFGFSWLHISFVGFMSLIVFILHKENIIRIIQGREKKLKQSVS